MEFFIETICPCDIVFAFDDGFYFLKESMAIEIDHLGFICFRKMVPIQKILHFFMLPHCVECVFLWYDLRMFWISLVSVVIYPFLFLIVLLLVFSLVFY